MERGGWDRDRAAGRGIVRDLERRGRPFRIGGRAEPRVSSLGAPAELRVSSHADATAPTTTIDAASVPGPQTTGRSARPVLFGRPGDADLIEALLLGIEPLASVSPAA
jgi:hypothetical protein